MDKITVVVVDDHNLFRQGLLRILADLDRLQVLGEASNGLEALQLIERLRPDVVLMDLNMPIMSGPEATRAIRDKHPACRVIMLTVSERDEDLFDAIRAGAQGYLLKNVQMAELLDAIERVHAGEAMVAPAMAVRLLSEFRTLSQQVPGSKDTEASQEDQTGLLTQREIEVLRHLAQGLGNKEIAERLGLSEHTVKTHLRNILEKLHLRSRAHAAAYAVQAGLVDKIETDS